MTERAVDNWHYVDLVQDDDIGRRRQYAGLRGHRGQLVASHAAPRIAVIDESDEEIVWAENALQSE